MTGETTRGGPTCAPAQTGACKQLPDDTGTSTEAGGDEPAADGWRDGWLLTARRCESPNAGVRPADARVDLALVHSISLPPGEYGGDAIERLFSNRLDWQAHPYFETIRGLRVSAHFLVRRDGECLQFVSCDARAWHAGRSSWRGRDDCNDFSIGIELEGLEGQCFEAPQYEALARLLERLRERYPLAAVAGHEHVAPGRKQDPGPGFDWPRLARMLPWMVDTPALSPEQIAAPDVGTASSSIGD